MIINSMCRGLMYLLYIPVIRNVCPDSWYVRCQYRYKMGKKLNLKDPRTFNEKIQWLKLNDRDPVYTKMSDKCQARTFVSDRLGENYLIPLIGEYDDFDDIDFTKFPQQFVIKCSHDSGSVVIVKDKDTMDVDAVKKKICKALRRNYFWIGREWAYKNIEPKIIVEKYLEDESGVELKDYKIFCFGGVPKFIQVDFDRFTNHRRNIYSPKWEYMAFTSMYPTDQDVHVPRPENLDEMLSVAETLSAGVPHVRVDLYSIGSDIKFGELTFYHGSGVEKYDPEEWDGTLGGWIDLDVKK